MSRTRASSFEHPGLGGHSLLDSGAGAKLERFGELVLARPDPQALWAPRLDAEAWNAADLTFVRESDRGGHWRARRGAPPAARLRAPEWQVALGGARIVLRATKFKHLGLFPEQATNWRFVADEASALDARQPRLLNLFGYTGVASVLAARAGYAVTHVDASRASIAWARENLAASEVSSDATRVLLDDASAFVRRAARRGERYHAILIDPPHYGRGPRGEKWQFEGGIGPLLEACGRLLEERARLVLSAYAIGISSITLENLVAGCLPEGRLERGELTLPETPGDGARPARLLPCGFCVRWSRG